MSNQTAPPSLGAHWKVSLAEITAFPVPKSGMPTIGDYTELGCVNDINFDLPGQESKHIRCGLNEAEWTVPGNIRGGNLTLDTKDFATVETDLLAFNRTRCVVKCETVDEEDAVVRTMIFVDWNPMVSGKANRDGDSETGLTASGRFQRGITTYA